MNEYLVITWTDSVPVEHGLAEAARDTGGQLLAAGPVHDASELESQRRSYETDGSKIHFA
jgi:hypothetical protein